MVADVSTIRFLVSTLTCTAISQSCLTSVSVSLSNIFFSSVFVEASTTMGGGGGGDGGGSGEHCASASRRVSSFRRRRDFFVHESSFAARYRWPEGVDWSCGSLPYRVIVLKLAGRNSASDELDGLAGAFGDIPAECFDVCCRWCYMQHCYSMWLSLQRALHQAIILIISMI